MTPHEWEDNRPPKEPRLTNLDYCVILGVSFALSSAMMVGDLLTIGIASWAWSAYERARVKQKYGEGTKFDLDYGKLAILCLCIYIAIKVS